MESNSAIRTKTEEGREGAWERGEKGRREGKVDRDKNRGRDTHRDKNRGREGGREEGREGGREGGRGDRKKGNRTTEEGEGEGRPRIPAEPHHHLKNAEQKSQI
jgi:hypothetical protein